MPISRLTSRARLCTISIARSRTSRSSIASLGVSSLRYPRSCESSLSQDLLPCMTLIPRLSSDISPSFSPLWAHIVAEPHHRPNQDDDNDNPPPGQTTGRDVGACACSDASRCRWCHTSWLRSRPSSGYPTLFTRVRERVIPGTSDVGGFSEARLTSVRRRRGSRDRPGALVAPRDWPVTFRN